MNMQTSTLPNAQPTSPPNGWQKGMNKPARFQDRETVLNKLGNALVHSGLGISHVEASVLLETVYDGYVHHHGVQPANVDYIIRALTTEDGKTWLAPHLKTVRDQLAALAKPVVTPTVVETPEPVVAAPVVEHIYENKNVISEQVQTELTALLRTARKDHLASGNREVLHAAVAKIIDTCITAGQNFFITPYAKGGSVMKALVELLTNGKRSGTLPGFFCVPLADGLDDELCPKPVLADADIQAYDTDLQRAMATYLASGFNRETRNAVPLDAVIKRVVETCQAKKVYELKVSFSNGSFPAGILIGRWKEVQLAHDLPSFYFQLAKAQAVVVQAAPKSSGKPGTAKKLSRAEQDRRKAASRAKRLAEQTAKGKGGQKPNPHGQGKGKKAKKK